MIPPRQIASTLGVFAMASICGVLLAGRATLTDEGEPRVTITPAKATKSERRHRTAVIPKEVLARLQRIDAAGNPQDRLRATIQLARSLPISELEAWYEGKWFNGREDIQSALFNEITLSRWLAADAEGLMRYCHRSDDSRGNQVAWRWARQDPKAALGYLAEMKDPAQRSQTADLMGISLAQYQPEEAIAGMPVLLSALRTYNLWVMMGKLAESSPEALKTAAAQWPDYVQRGIARELATAGLKRDFEGTLAELRQREDGRNLFLEAFPFHSKALQEVMKNPESLPPGWFGDIAVRAGSLLVTDDPERWVGADLIAMGMSPEQSRQVRQMAIAEIGAKDQQRFLSLLEDGGYDRYARQHLITSAVQRLADDKAKAEAWIAGLTDSKDIEDARQALATRLDQPEGKAITPSDLLTGLGQDGATLTTEQARAAGMWGGMELKIAANRFDTLPADQKTVAARNLLSHSHEDFPPLLQAQAIRYLASDRAIDPGIYDGITGRRELSQSAALLAVKWGKDDPVATSQWVSSLPTGDERLWAAKNLAATWTEYEPAATRQWVATLGEEDRRQVLEYLESGKAHHD
jgi:hypothetical protein